MTSRRETLSFGLALGAVSVLGTDQFRASEREAIQAEIQRMQQSGGTVIRSLARLKTQHVLQDFTCSVAY